MNEKCNVRSEHALGPTKFDDKKIGGYWKGFGNDESGLANTLN